MKKAFVLSSLVVSGLFFVSCSNSEPDENAEKEGDAVEAVTEETKDELEAARNLKFEAQELEEDIDNLIDSLQLN